MVLPSRPMTMPLMPGLMGQGAAAAGAPAGDEGGGSLAELLKALPPDELTALVADADKAKEAGDLEGYLPDAGAEPDAAASEEAAESPADEAAETPEEQAQEDAAGTEQHDAEAFVTTIESVASELEAMQDQLDAAVDDAKERDLDVDGDKDVAKAIKDATKAVASAQKDAEKAVKKEDVQAAAAAADEATQALADAQAAFDEYNAAVEAAAGEAAAAEGEGEAPPEAKAMKAWASRT